MISPDHIGAERFANDADAAARRSDMDVARELYRKAAQLEDRALLSVTADLPRTRSLLSVSAASLWFKGADFDQAEAVAYRALLQGGIEDFARYQLREVLQAAWAERAVRATRETSDQHIGVTLIGPMVREGVAPMSIILETVGGLKSILFRVAELLAGC